MVGVGYGAAHQRAGGVEAPCAKAVGTRKSFIFRECLKRSPRGFPPILLEPGKSCLPKDCNMIQQAQTVLFHDSSGTGLRNAVLLPCKNHPATVTSTLRRRGFLGETIPQGCDLGSTGIGQCQAICRLDEARRKRVQMLQQRLISKKQIEHLPAFSISI